MRGLDASDLLALWERGAPRQALDRTALLCAWARPELQADEIADLPLGAVTSSLLRLREASFGARISCHIDCEECGERLELVLGVPELLQPVSSEDETRSTEVGGFQVRTPTLRDLAALAREPDAARAARQLLARCAAGKEGTPSDAVAALPDDALRAVEDALETLDPNADLAFGVSCEACGHRGMAQLDAGVMLWDEIDARARALLAEVDALARAYGWSEGEILALGATRRATYLSLVCA
jgi:hypothetical protein